MEFKALNFKSEDIEGRTFRGYAATFDQDQANDIIKKGAFTKTLSERADRVKILWEHRDPIGKPISMVEDEKGLLVEGLISKTRLGDEALELMRDGVVDQMSIGFVVPEGKSTQENNSRIIHEIKLFEFSPVTFPCNEKAFILSVKNINEAINSKAFYVDEASKKSLLDAIDKLHLMLKNEPHSTQKNTKPNVLKQSDIDAIFKKLNSIKI